MGDRRQKHLDATVSAGAIAPPEGPADPAYLLVFEGHTAWRYPLPAAGEVVIGRAQEAHLRVEDPSASRTHAKLLIAGGQVRVLDLDSHNGTRVNGERISGSRPLTSGDVIAISPAASMVFHAAPLPLPARRLSPAVRARLEEEVDRARRYGRALSVAALDLSEAGGGQAIDAVLTEALEDLRPIDAAGRTDSGALLLVLPELHRDAALEPVELAIAALARAGLRTRAGLASCPEDAADAQTLIAAALAASRAAKEGRVATATDAVITRDIGGRSFPISDPAMLRVFELIERIAQAEVPVLITGETGAGKEIAAGAVHWWSKRRRGPFVVVSCAAIPENLVESELFGHDKGAFSGALTAKAGFLEAASGGTLFLDELGELSPSAQAKLLRALETKRVTRLGETTERPVDIRLVAATHRALEKEVAEGRFRQDLYYRLAAARVAIPPLRDRRSEIPVIARALLAPTGKTFSDAALHALSQHDWPGNVRELKNLVELLAATVEGDRVEAWHLPEVVRAHHGPADPTPKPRFRPIDEEVRELERMRMAEALEATGGVQTKAAALISMPLRTFVTKLKQYGLKSRGP